MEKAILKTLIYADIFDYPLKSYEISKWLIGKKSSFKQVEKTLVKLIQESKIQKQKEYFFLKGKEGFVYKRQAREKQSKKYLFKAKFFVWFLKFVPTLKLVGISGGLALNNAEITDDIDLFLITVKERIWLTRILVIFILDFLGVRRRVKMKPNQVGGKLCLNILLEEDRVEQENKDIYTAHEVLQMKVLWQKGSIYKKYLEKNSWAFEFLPNWIGDNSSLRGEKRRSNLVKRLPLSLWSLAMTEIENLAKRFQLKVMQKPKGMERIGEGILYFHPNDIRPFVLKEFKQRVKNLSNT